MFCRASSVGGIFLLCSSPVYFSLENVRLYILVERYVVVYVDRKAGYCSLERSSIDVEANAIDVCQDVRDVLRITRFYYKLSPSSRADQEHGSPDT